MPEAVLPYFARRGEFVPVENGHLIVSLPGETVRSEVLQVPHRDLAIVRLGNLLGKGGHIYKPKDIVTCQRQQSDIGGEVWCVVDERKLHEMETAERLAAEMIERAASASKSVEGELPVSTMPIGPGGPEEPATMDALPPAPKVKRSRRPAKPRQRRKAAAK